MHIAYRVNESLDEAELQKLYRQAPWARKRSLEGIAAMLQHTPVQVSAWLGESLVGFARALTDTQYRALVDDVIVDEEYRHRGIGTELVKRITDELAHLDEVYLMCGPPLAGFYMRHGYERPDCVTLRRDR